MNGDWLSEGPVTAEFEADLKTIWGPTFVLLIGSSSIHVCSSCKWIQAR